MANTRSDLISDAINEDRSHKGELQAMPRRDRKLAIIGAISGALFAGFITFMIFWMVADLIGFPYRNGVLAVATGIAIFHGGFLGMLVTLRFTRRQSRKLLHV